MASPTPRETKKRQLAIAAIDFGTTCTGYAYHLRKSKADKMKDINIEQAWPGSAEMGLQAPTTVLMTSEKKFHSFGFEAEEKYKSLSIDNEHSKWYFFQFFKMSLHHEQEFSRDMILRDAGHKPMKAMIIFTEAIRYIRDHLLRKVRAAVVDVVFVEEVFWVLTVPAIWRDAAKQFMREAAVKAGIPADMLLLALEPEAAAISCKELAVAKTEGVDGIFLRAFNPGKKYFVLDLGGGTIDTTVHEVMENGKLTELHAATGGDWGGIVVNKAFEKYIRALVGEDAFRKFCTEDPSHWIEFQKSFERKKRQFSPSTEIVDLEFPFYLERCFQDLSKSTLSKRLENYKNAAILKPGYLRLFPETMKMFFNEAVSKINHHIEELLAKEHLRDVSTILLVGGFAESRIVSDSIKTYFKTKQVIAPPSASVAILKGAVMYGIDRNIISSRVSPYSYGVHTRAKFNEAIHPAIAKTEHNGVFVVRNAFDKFIEVGETIQVGGLSKVRKYQVYNTKNKQVYWNVYKSPKKEPGTCNGCSKIGKLAINIPSSIETEKVYLEVSMTCRGTELEATARTADKHVECKAYFDFLGMDDSVAGDEYMMSIPEVVE